MEPLLACTVTELKPCGHMYHESCIRSWFEQSPKCCLCRGAPHEMQQHQVDAHGSRELQCRRAVQAAPEPHVIHDGVNGDRFIPDTILTPFQRAVLRVFRQLLVDSDPDAALVGMNDAAVRQLRSSTTMLRLSRELQARKRAAGRRARIKHSRG